MHYFGNTVITVATMTALMATYQPQRVPEPSTLYAAQQQRIATPAYANLAPKPIQDFPSRQQDADDVPRPSPLLHQERMRLSDLVERENPPGV